jgi:hypothetical protein
MSTRGDQATLPAQPGADVGWRLPPAGIARWLAALGSFPRGAARAAHPYPLARDATLTFRAGRRGLALACESGVFLVTQEGDPDDHVLEAGDTFRTAAPGRVVAWAFQAGVLIGPSRR